MIQKHQNVQWVHFITTKHAWPLTYFFGMSIGKCSKFTKASTIFEYLVGPPDKGVRPGVAPDGSGL